MKKADEMRTEMEKVSDEIYSAETRLVELSLENEKDQEQIDGMTTTIEADVSAEINPNTGKAMFSNETARKAEVTGRVGAHETIQSMKRILGERLKETKLQEIKVGRLHRQYRTLQAVAGIMARAGD